MVVVAVLVAAPEALTEVIPVILGIYVVSVVAVGRVLERVTVIVVRSPTVLTVCLSGTKTFLIAVIYGLAQGVSAVLIDLVIGAAAMVAIYRGCVEVGIVIVVVPLLAKTPILVTEMLQILLLEAILRHPPLLLQDSGLLLETALLLIQPLAINGQALLLLLN